ncbi:MAG TPA: metalloregulator ArsR/SmtB family transcription factor [Thermoleophilia bacterium]|nr:metalloregulator ArsR/SmtB family transcription factor [Thermoleophilia bacterium]
MTATHTARRVDVQDEAAAAHPAAAPASQLDADCGHSPAVPPRMTRDRAAAVADVFKVLADPSRVLMLEALKESGELCVLHLADAVSMSQSAVSHNLRLLRQAGLVTRRRDGRLVYYRPDDDHVTGLISLCGDHVAHQERGTRA